MSKPNQKNLILGIMIDVGQLLNQITAALEDHEKRLQLVETSQLENDLEKLKNQVNQISDQKKRLEAINALKSLYDLLGIPDLEN